MKNRKVHLCGFFMRVCHLAQDFCSFLRLLAEDEFLRRNSLFSYLILLHGTEFEGIHLCK